MPLSAWSKFLDGDVNFASAFAELSRFCLHNIYQRCGFIQALWTANSRTCWLICIEQNFGPHMQQKCATLQTSLGRVSS